MYIEIAVVVVLTAINGLLAMSELAIVSSRPARLRVLDEQGVAGAGLAMTLAGNPGRFLSTVQIGITLVGVLSGAFSGATLGLRLSNWLVAQGVSAGFAEAIGVGAVVVAITYLSLIVGELVPKQIALRNPEKVAAKVAPAMSVLSSVSSPLVWLLDMSGRAVLRLLGHGAEQSDRVTEEEVKTVIAEADSAGLFEHGEREMISAVMRLADRNARALMTPRRDVEFVDLAGSPEVLRGQIRATRRARLPVRDGSDDSVLGVVFVKDLFDDLIDGKDLDIRGRIQAAPAVMDVTASLEVLKTIRDSSVHMALVFDEYGHFEGVVTSGDILEAITGTFRESLDDEPSIIERADGSFLIAGWLPVDELADRFHVTFEKSSGFETVAGLILDRLGRLPKSGETVEVGNLRFEVVDMDGRRIDKILMSRNPA